MSEIFWQAVFADNLALAYFLGMCTFLAVSRRVDTALGLGVAIIAVQALTLPLNHLIYVYALRAGAWGWAGLADVDLSFLRLVAFIGTIAAAVQVLEMVLERFAPALHDALGIFLPLITVNCAILGASLFMVERRYDFTESVAYALGSGVGWALAVVLFAALRERLRYSRVPRALNGLGLAFVVAGLLSLGFSVFATVVLP